MPKQALWEGMLQSFRELGGKAENICLRKGPLGRGLFCVDASRPVTIGVPDRLLVQLDDLSLEDGTLRLGRRFRPGGPQKVWLENYLNRFSWGPSRGPIERFLKSLLALPEPLRHKLAYQFGVRWCVTDFSEQTVLTYYFLSRAVSYRGSIVLTPLVDLANHGPRAPLEVGWGISLGGHFEGEVLFDYGWQDPLGRFLGWGFASPEPLAFSVPLTVKASFGDLNITRRPTVAAFLDSAELGRVKVPEFQFEGDKASMSHLVLGMTETPGLPKALFYRFLQQVGASRAEETFDQIRQLNFLRFLDLLESLEGLPGSTARSLRSMALYQLKALSCCTGACAL